MDHFILQEEAEVEPTGYIPFSSPEQLRAWLPRLSLERTKTDPRFFYDEETGVVITLVMAPLGSNRRQRRRPERELTPYCIFFADSGAAMEAVASEYACSGYDDIHMRDYKIAAVLAARQGLEEDRQRFLAKASEIMESGFRDRRWEEEAPPVADYLIQ